jgi:hypothetical protein
MNIIAEMAKARARIEDPTREELIASARYMVSHPDTPRGAKRMFQALIEEIDLGKKRLATAIRYAAKLRS